MKKVFLLAAAAIFALSACTDGTEGGDGGAGGLTPEEHKAKLEQVATDLNALITPDAFDDFADAVDYLVNELPELPFFEDETDRPEKGYVSGLMNAAVPLFSGQLAAVNSIAVVATRTAESWDIKDNYGVYTYSETNEEWVKADDTGKLELVYDYDDEKVKITLVATGEAEVVTGDDDKTYSVPSKVTVKMLKGSDILVDVIVNVVSLNGDARTGEVNVSVDIVGYSVVTTTKVTSTTITATASLKKGATLMVSAKADGKGSNFTDENNSTINQVNASANVMDQVYVKGSCNNLKKYFDEEDKLDDETTDWQSKAYAEAAAKLFNDNFKVFMNYDNSGDAVANYKQKAVQVDDEWYVHHNMIFSDNSPYDIEDYFDTKKFTKLLDALKDLGGKFDSLFSYDENVSGGSTEVTPDEHGK